MPKTTPTPPELPLVKGTFLLGHLLNAKKEGVHFYSRMNREHGDALKLKIVQKTYYLFLNPEYNREILVDNPDQFIKGKQYNPLRLLLGNGLLTSEGKKWSNQRRMLNPLFGREAMDLLLVHIDRISQKYSDHVEINSDINWTKYMFDYTLEVAIASFFGSNFPDQKRIRFTEASHRCIRFVSKRMSNFFSPPLILPFKEHILLKKTFLYLKSAVEDIYNLRLKNTELPSRDMLDLLMRAEDEESGERKTLSRVEVWDQILSFMIAGHETTALTMSWH